MISKIIAQGAEAILTRKGKEVIKNRVRKGYRIVEIDNRIRRQRTRKEARLLGKASLLIPVPKLVKLDENKSELILEFIDGKKLSENLDKISNSIEVCKIIGKQIALLHDSGIIHGDLTTSNMIYSNKKIYFIDFGLGYESNSDEDKAVDLHLIKQALEAKHFKHYEKYWKAIIFGYKASKNYKLVLNRLEKVEARGRYKQAY
jgi:TP53 regulating kinase-like protein